jgi:hypothetical protein
VHPHAAALDVEVAHPDAVDLAAVASDQSQNRGGTVAAGAGDERRLVAQVDHRALGQGAYVADSTARQFDVAGGVNVGEAEFTRVR